MSTTFAADSDRIDAHSPSDAASAYGTAFWVAAALTALAIVPCIILTRAERAARRGRAAGRPPADAMTEAVAA